jgi:hypothetical protein
MKEELQAKGAVALSMQKLLSPHQTHVSFEGAALQLVQVK